MVMEGDGGRWWRGVNEVVVLVGHKHEAGEGAGGQNTMKPSTMA